MGLLHELCHKLVTLVDWSLRAVLLCKLNDLAVELVNPGSPLQDRRSAHIEDR